MVEAKRLAFEAMAGTLQIRRMQTSLSTSYSVRSLRNVNLLVLRVMALFRQLS